MTSVSRVLTTGRRSFIVLTKSAHARSGNCVFFQTRRWATSEKSNEVAQSVGGESTDLDSAKITKASGNHVHAHLELSKAKLSALVVSTSAFGFLAAGAPFSPGILSSCLIGTALCSSSAAAWNQILEVDRDKLMKRTQQRPLVTGALSVDHAKVVATLFGVAGVSILQVGTDPVTAALGASNIVLYAGVYTWMKPRSIYNTWVGAVVGAVPPVMGWTAATGGSLMDAEALLLGATLYLWQMPHFFALSYMHRVDYRRGGFAMLPVVEPTGKETAEVIRRYAAYLSTLPFVATLTGTTSSMFAFEGLALNAYAFHVANTFYHDRTNANARRVFLTSLWYLPSYMVLFLLHSKVWDKEEESEVDLVRKELAKRIHAVRDWGRQMCLHEKVVEMNVQRGQDGNASEQPDGAQNCPVVLGSQTSRAGVDAITNNARSAASVANVQRET